MPKIDWTVIPINLYLTDEDYKIAESNGISKQLADDRFYDWGWTAARSIGSTKALTATSNRFERLLQEAHANGVEITLSGVKARIYNGMSEREAITIPRGGKYKDKYLERAMDNGISRQTYHKRVRVGWDKETASTHPVGKRRKRSEVIPQSSETDIDRILNVEVKSPHADWW